MTEILIDKTKLAKRLAISTRTLHRLCDARQIPFISIPTPTGTRPIIRFRESEITAWLEGRARSS